jgi:hypothetical protein
MRRVIFAISLLFFGCTPEEEGVPVILESNSSEESGDGTTIEDSSNDTTSSSSDEVLSLTSTSVKTSLELDIGKSDTISFIVDNYTSSTKISFENSSIISISSASCNSVDGKSKYICSSNITGLSAGTTPISVGVEGKDGVSKLIFFATVNSVESSENLDEVLSLASVSSSTSFQLEAGETTKIYFLVENYVDSSLLAITLSKTGVVSSGTALCPNSVSETQQLCSVSVSGVSGGTTTIVVSVDGKSSVTPLLFSISVEESTVLDETLSLTSVNSPTSFQIEVDKTETLSFVVDNYSSSTLLTTSFTNGGVVSNTAPSCATAISDTKRLCSLSFTGVASGSDTLNIGISGKSSVTPLSLSITVEELVDEILMMTSVNSPKSFQIEVDETETVSFVVDNYTSLTEVKVALSDEVVQFTEPTCPTVVSDTKQLCSLSFTGVSGGEGTLSLTIAGKESVEPLVLSIAVEGEEVVLPDEIISMTSVNSPTTFQIEIAEKKVVSFLVDNYSDSTEIEISLSEEILQVTEPLCSISISETKKLCSFTFTGVSSGDEKISIGVSEKSEVEPLTLSVTVAGEGEVEDIVDPVDENSSTDENSSEDGEGEQTEEVEDNGTISQDSEMSLTISTSKQSSSLNLLEGDQFFVVSKIENPDRLDREVTVAIQKNLVEILSHTKDEDNSTEVFTYRTVFRANQSGSDQIYLRVSDSNLSERVDIDIELSLCGLNSEIYDICEAPCDRNEIYFNKASGFDQAYIIYLPSENYSQWESQNLIHISSSGEEALFSDSASLSSIAVMKISEDLEGETFQLKYLQDGESSFQCIGGVFPERYLFDSDEVEAVIEVEEENISIPTIPELELPPTLN